MIIRYGAWQPAFFNPGQRPTRRDVFGCATHGAVVGRQWSNVENAGLFTWGDALRGCVFAGAYSEVLTGVNQCAFRPTFMLALFAHSEGVGAFIEGLSRAMPGAPLAGGVSAMAAGAVRGELMPDAQDVALLMCESDDFTLTHHNPLEARGGIYEFDAPSPRALKRLREPDMPWEDAARVMSTLKSRYRITDDEGAFTFSDNDGYNLGLTPDGQGGLMSGSDLPEKGYLHPRASDRESVEHTITQYAQIKRALIMGDARHARMTPRPFAAADSSTVVFLSGQIVDGKHAELMLTSIRA